MKRVLVAFAVGFAFWVAAVTGCSRKAEADTSGAVAPAKPREAANQLEQAFTAADQDLKKVADAASTALRTSDYEAAVQSLSLMKEQGDLTLDQGLAIHNSLVSLEGRLITAAAAGDANAIRAYEQLKRSRRN
jgi:hypothetical protein